MLCAVNLSAYYIVSRWLIATSSVSSFTIGGVTALSMTTNSNNYNNMNDPQVISVKSAGFQDVNGIYHPKSPSIIPAGFDRTCCEMNWDTNQMWNQLSDPNVPWFEAQNESYIYWNKGDGKWWIDGPSGAGVYIVPRNSKNDMFPPKDGWISLRPNYEPPPTVEITPEGEL